MISVEVFTAPNCAKCGKAKDILRNRVHKMNDVQWREVSILEEIDYAIHLGVLSTPAIAINGKLVFTGLPSKKQFDETLFNYK